MAKQPESDQLSFGQRVAYYFTQLEFYSDRQHLGNDNSVGWTIGVYLLASLGIFSRQITNFPKVNMNLANLQWNVLITSFIFGLASLPFFIKRINEAKPTPGFQQIISAFGLGFFMDFTTNAIINFYFKST